MAAALSLAPIHAQQDPLQPPDLSHFLRWGPIRARPALVLSNLGYDNNIFYRTDIPPVGDYTGTITGKVDGLVLFGPRAFLTFTEQLDYTTYLRNGDQNYLNQLGSGRITIPFVRFGVYLDAALNDYKERPADQLDVRTDVREKRLGPGFILKLGSRTDAEIGWVRSDFNYTDPNDLGVGSDRDRVENGQRILLRYLLLGRTRLTFEADRRDIAFDNPTVGRNALRRGYVPGVDFGAGGRLSGSVKVGWVRLDPTSPTVPDFSGAVGEIHLAYRFGSGTTALLSGKRDVQFAIYVNDVYILPTSYEARLVHYFGRIWGAEAGASRGRLSFPVSIDRIDRYDQWDAGVRLRLMTNALGRRVEYTLRFTHWALDSTLDNLDQTRSTVGINAVIGY